MQNYHLDLSKNSPIVIPAVFEDSYRADKITIVLPIGKDWSPLELDVSVKNVKQRWDEVGRTQKGHTPNRSFSSLIVHYNDMTYEALIVHISNINRAQLRFVGNDLKC